MPWPSEGFQDLKILLVDDEDMVAYAIEQELTSLGAELAREGSVQRALERFPRFQPDIAVIDLSLPDGNGMELMRKWHKDDPQLLSIVITAHADVDSAIEAVRLGAFNYLKKPFRMEELVQVVERARELSQLRSKINRLQGPLKPREKIHMIGESYEMQKLKGRIAKLAKSRVDTILIVGPSGSGKELAARMLHFDSDRRLKPFVEINCASIPESLLESELFGFEKGAFTDARERKLGLFEMAREGTIFLDEMGEMPYKLQAKLLRVLEYRRFKRLGGVRDIDFSARIICATNRNLLEEIREKRFREDLFYRLNVIDVQIPPLNDHLEDLKALAEHFIKEQAKLLGLVPPELSPNALTHLESHHWPGNIRELKHVIQKALVLHEPKTLRAEHLEWTSLPPPASSFEEQEFKLPESGISLEKVEKDFLLQALAQSRQNQTKAAQLLGVSRHTLRYRLEKYGLLGFDSKEKMS